MNNSLNINKLLNTAEAAAILHMSKAWVIKTRWAGGGPRFLKLGKSVRYNPVDLSDYISTLKRFHTSEPAPVAK